MANVGTSNNTTDANIGNANVPDVELENAGAVGELPGPLDAAVRLQPRVDIAPAQTRKGGRKMM
jgi:hypothetical protein